MKILQVNCVYNTGSTGKIVADIHFELLKRGVESVVCYGRGAKVNERGIYKTCGELYSKFNNLVTRFSGIMYGGCRVSTHKLIGIIKMEKPDIVHLHCINGYFVNIYKLIKWLKRKRIKTVLTLHAEFMYTANCGHAMDCDLWKSGCKNCPKFKKETKSLIFNRTAQSWKKMKAAFDGFEKDCLITSVSPWLMERAKQAPILKNFKHKTIMNGVDTNTFHIYDKTDLREKYGLTDKKFVIHVTPAFSLDKGHIKGGWYMAELAKRMPDVVFAVIGGCGECSDLPENLLNIGRVENQIELAKWYSAADICLLTSKQETFSMVTAESLCCGTPVVGFKAGAPEVIAPKEHSVFVEYGDLSALEAALKIQLAKDVDNSTVAESAQARFCRENMCEEFVTAYGELI